MTVGGIHLLRLQVCAARRVSSPIFTVVEDIADKRIGGGWGQGLHEVGDGGSQPCWGWPVVDCLSYSCHACDDLRIKQQVDSLKVCKQRMNSAGGFEGEPPAEHLVGAC